MMKPMPLKTLMLKALTLKALTLGGAMIDTIAIIDNDRIEKMTMLNADKSFLLLEEGKKTESKEISTHTGGGAVNAAVSLARQGFEVATLVKMGQDQRGENVLLTLRQEGIDTRFVCETPVAPTGSSVIVSSHDKNAAIFTFRGANTLLEPQDLADEAFAVDLVYIASLSNNSADCFPLIVEKAKAKGAFVATNPGVRQLTSRANAFETMLPKIDLLALNRLEACVLIPKLVAKYGEGGESLGMAHKDFDTGNFRMSLKKFFTLMQREGSRYMLVTDGGHGAYLAAPKGIFHCPILKVDVVGTAGAGDAFTSTLTAALVAGEEEETALIKAALNAASVVGVADTQSGLLKGDILNARLAALREKFVVTKWAW
jgi:ribokinase